ncbi:MAG: DnaB-like helicase C-terminal domain-containing protein [Flavobacteriales bacterium AspAUS03]
MLSELFNSRNIEQNADIVLFRYRPKYYDMQE